jgi:release factor glutamine methyltransferase
VRESIADALAGAAQRLARSGIADPRREATALWAAVAQVKPGDVWLARARQAPPAVAGRFRESVDARADGVPFAYAVGRVSFRSLELLIDQRALIPRPETEALVDLALREGPGGLAADVGTGCGCIALALATEGRFQRVVAVERSADAAALARENAALVNPPTPVEVREGDLLAPLAGKHYRVIVANPPYLTEAEYAALDPCVRWFEPRDALVGGPDGLAATRRLLEGAGPLLAPGGRLVLEIDERRADAVRALAAQYGWARIDVHDDLFGRPRYALAFPREG